jgi:sterol desaturase/sphingolipid hydroxylase (fatty acid hydroxylase superfamily)
MNTHVKPQSKGSRQLFENPILEKLSRTHIVVPVTLFFIYSGTLLYWNTKYTTLHLPITILLFFVGMLTFTWVEYMVHRYVFHMKTYTRIRAKIQYTLHGVHHEFPKDKDRLAMPPLLSITISTVLLLILKVIMGDFVFAFLPGFLVGYALYLSVHYLVHAYPPPKNFFKALWVNHSVHHYKDGEVVFGVSTPLWDYIYGTMKLKENKDTKIRKTVWE